MEQLLFVTRNGKVKKDGKICWQVKEVSEITADNSIGVDDKQSIILLSTAKAST